MEARKERSKGVPVCSVDISGVTLRDLVSMFYPFSQDTTLPFGRLASLARAAHRYNIPGAIASARKQLVPLIQQDPLKGWVLANAYGWAEEWEASAREIASRCLSNQWVAEMEDVPAYPYYRLLRFCHFYAVEVGKFMRSQVPNSGTIWWSQHTDPTTPVSLPLVELTSNATELAIRHGGSCFFCGYYTNSHRHDCPYFLQVWPANKKTYGDVALSFFPHWDRLFKKKLLEVSSIICESFCSMLKVDHQAQTGGLTIMCMSQCSSAVFCGSLQAMQLLVSNIDIYACNVRHSAQREVAS